ncbi:uncharacterized protein [Amphiura filiformis]|uniref:uncharacterized protein n=1 Tax=Amphiura filiformis TaxID=82378 RepID=UPI003B222E9B
MQIHIYSWKFYSFSEMASCGPKPFGSTPSPIPTPNAVNTEKKCVICQCLVGNKVDPTTGKRNRKSYKFLHINVQLENILSKFVDNHHHPSNYICQTCSRKVETIEKTDKKRLELIEMVSCRPKTYFGTRPTPTPTPTNIERRCVICHCEVGKVDPITGKRNKNSYKFLLPNVHSQLKIGILSKLVLILVDNNQHPSNYICQACARKVETTDKNDEKRLELIADYNRHVDSIQAIEAKRTKRMLKDSPSRKMMTCRHPVYYLKPHICQYCKRTFHHTCRYLIHLRHHDMLIKPYWYGMYGRRQNIHTKRMPSR